MKITSTSVLSALLLATSACQQGEEALQAPTVASEACACDTPPVKTVKNVEGTIGFDSISQQYYIRRGLPGTYDSVDFGMLCGTVPASLQLVGDKVVFSGTYKPYDKQPPVSGLAGQRFYYLEVSSANVQTGQ